MRDRSVSSRPARDEGLGLAEIIVAMMVIALLSVAVLPLLIQGLKMAALNATVASATQLVQDRMETARAGQTCASVTALDGLTTTTPDARGVSFDITGDVLTPCPATFPALVKLSISVARTDEPLEILSTATTLVLVTAAS